MMKISNILNYYVVTFTTESAGYIYMRMYRLDPVRDAHRL